MSVMRVVRSDGTRPSFVNLLAVSGLYWCRKPTTSRVLSSADAWLRSITGSFDRFEHAFGEEARGHTWRRIVVAR